MIEPKPDRLFLFACIFPCGFPAEIVSWRGPENSQDDTHQYKEDAYLNHIGSDGRMTL